VKDMIIVLPALGLWLGGRCVARFYCISLRSNKIKDKMHFSRASDFTYADMLRPFRPEWKVGALFEINIIFSYLWAAHLLIILELTFSQGEPPTIIFIRCRFEKGRPTPNACIKLFFARIGQISEYLFQALFTALQGNNIQVVLQR
jgi:hypothetical protein